MKIERKKRKNTINAHIQQPKLPFHPLEHESHSKWIGKIKSCKNDYSKSSAVLRYKSLRVGAGGANPGISLMSLLLGFTT